MKQKLKQGLKQELKQWLFLLLLFMIYPLTPLFPLDLSLDQAGEYTRLNSESVRLKLLEIEEKKYALKETAAKRFPGVDVQASATYMTNPPEGITIHKGMFGYAPTINSENPIPFPDRDYVLIEDPENTYFKITTTLTQPVFTWNKINNAIRIAKDDVRLSEMSYEQALNEVYHELSKIYFGTLFAEESGRILENAKGVLSEILADRKKSYDEGLINLQKVLEAESNLAAMEAKCIEVSEAYKSGIAAISFYTGIESGEIRLTTYFRDTIPDLDEEKIKQHTITHSHDLNILRGKLNQARTYLDIEKGSDILRPDFSFILSLDIKGQRIPIVGANWMDTWDHNLTFTLGTRVTLYDGGKAGNKIKKAEITSQMAETGVQQLEKALALQVLKAIQEVRVKYYTVLEKKAKLADGKEQYKNAKVSYENELLTREEERGARVLLYSQELEYLLSLYEYEMALTDLEFLSGMEF